MLTVHTVLPFVQEVVDRHAVLVHQAEVRALLDQVERGLPLAGGNELDDRRRSVRLSPIHIRTTVHERANHLGIVVDGEQRRVAALWIHDIRVRAVREQQSHRFVRGRRAPEERVANEVLPTAHASRASIGASVEEDSHGAGAASLLPHQHERIREKIVAALILRRRWSLAFQQPGERRRVVLRNRSGQRRRGGIREVTHVRLGDGIAPSSLRPDEWISDEKDERPRHDHRHRDEPGR